MEHRSISAVVSLVEQGIEDCLPYFDFWRLSDAGGTSEQIATTLSVSMCKDDLFMKTNGALRALLARTLFLSPLCGIFRGGLE